MLFGFTPLLTGFVVLEWCLRVLALFIVPRRQRPSSANAWLLLILITPTFGLLLFYMFGNPKLPKHRRKKRHDMDQLTEKEIVEFRKRNKGLFSDLSKSRFDQVARLATTLGGLPPMSRNKVEVIQDYEDAFRAIAVSIDDAKEYVHIEYFIAVLDPTTLPVFSAIKRAVDRGVKVRFLYDRVLSNKHNGHKKMVNHLDVVGVEYFGTLPLSLIPGNNFTRPDLRNHRKIVVVDGVVAFSGSQNLINRSYSRKDDLYFEEMMMKLEGPVVWQMNSVFRADWYSETNETLSELLEDEDISESSGSVTAQVLPSGPSHNHENNLKLYTSMVHAARSRISIVVPYFIPDESFLDAIITAAQRGVEVSIVNSEALEKILAGHAQRSYYEELLEAGVNVYLYNSPAFLHTKQVLIDDDVAIVGSSNLDIRSFALDLELNVIFYDKKVVKKLRSVEAGYLMDCTRITLKSWQDRSFKNKTLDNIARLTSALQ